MPGGIFSAGRQTAHDSTPVFVTPQERVDQQQDIVSTLSGSQEVNPELSIFGTNERCTVTSEWNLRAIRPVSLGTDKGWVDEQ
jgi:hypothetical protein